MNCPKSPVTISAPLAWPYAPEFKVVATLSKPMMHCTNTCCTIHPRHLPRTKFPSCRPPTQICTGMRSQRRPLGMDTIHESSMHLYGKSQVSTKTLCLDDMLTILIAALCTRPSQQSSLAAASANELSNSIWTILIAPLFQMPAFQGPASHSFLPQSHLTGF